MTTMMTAAMDRHPASTLDSPTAFKDLTFLEPLVHKYISFQFGRCPNEHGGRWNETPLLEAARMGDEGSVFLLLLLQNTNNATNSNNSNNTNTTPTNSSSTLLEARNIRNRTALHCAAAASNLRIARLLLHNHHHHHHSRQHHCCRPKEDLTEQEEDFFLLATDVRGETALHAAVRAGSFHVVRLLLAQRNPEPSPASLLSSFSITTNNQNACASQERLVHGKNNDGDTALHLAAERGCASSTHNNTTNCSSSSAFRVYGATGLDPVLPSPSNDPSQQSLVQLLLQHGADVDATNSYGSTPLHRAAAEGQLHVVELLLAHGANVNAQDQWGHTPRDVARNGGHVTTAEQLIDFQN